MSRRLLFVDDEPVIRATLAVILARHGFEVSTAATVPEALQKITVEKFEVLLSDLNIGNPGDGLTVVSAMRRTQPEAVTMILTGYPAFETALEAIRQQVDDYIVKPANIPQLVSAIESKLASPLVRRPLPPPQRVGMLLQEHRERVLEVWLSILEKNGAQSARWFGTEESIDNSRALLERIIRAAQSYSVEEPAERPSFSFPGKGRHGYGRRGFEGYTPHKLLAEFCYLRQAIAQVVQENLLAVNLSFLVPDLAQVNEALDLEAQVALATFSEGAATDPE